MIEELLTNLDAVLERSDLADRRRGLAELLHRIAHDLNSPIGALLLEVGSLSYAHEDATAALASGRLPAAAGSIAEAREICDNLSLASTRLEALSRLLSASADRMRSSA